MSSLSYISHFLIIADWNLPSAGLSSADLYLSYSRLVALMHTTSLHKYILVNNLPFFLFKDQGA